MTTSTRSAIETLTRGVDAVYSVDELKEKLAAGRPLRIKLGMDPTAPDIHLGHTVVLRKMRQFQDLGHTAVLIIGDYTARIGDPTGRDTTRPVLDQFTIVRNAETYMNQAGRILDTSSDRLQVRRNSEWLGGLNFADVLQLTGEVTVQQMLHRDMFRRRMADQHEIVVSEFMYPLMQAYDSVVIEADVELGGTDQTFNNLMGRDLMANRGMERQVVVIMPILAGLDGHEKMSKTKGNAVAVTDEPDDMFGKVMSIPDELMENYLCLLTDLPEPRIRSLVDPAQTHPREAKDILARIVVESFHEPQVANEASAEFRRRFSEHKLPTNLEVRTVTSSPIGILQLITSVDFAPSNSEARRLVQQGAVTLDDQKVTDPTAKVEIDGVPVLKVGKRRVCRVRVR